jgi:hypothetical protein
MNFDFDNVLDGFRNMILTFNFNSFPIKDTVPLKECIFRLNCSQYGSWFWYHHKAENSVMVFESIACSRYFSSYPRRRGWISTCLHQSFVLSLGTSLVILLFPIARICRVFRNAYLDTFRVHTIYFNKFIIF